MNFGDLKDTFYAYANVTSSDVDDLSLARWFNEAALDLSYELGPIKSHTLTGVIAGQGVDLPSDALSLIDAAEPYARNTVGQLVFDGYGNVDIYYRRLPKVFATSGGTTATTNHEFTGTDDTEESELHQALHILFVLFACSRYWDGESEGDSEEAALATKWMSSYYQGKQQSIAKLAAVIGTSNATCWTVVD